MRKNRKFLVLLLCLCSAICDPIDDACGFDEPESYQVTIENVAETYLQNETIWVSAQTSSMLIDFCTDNNDSVIIEDAALFTDGLFVLKLNDNLEGLNAEVVLDASITYSKGQSLTFDACSDAISHTPVITDDNLTYEYRLGLSVTSPGDYCIVSATANNFDLSVVNNAFIFENYNNLDDKIKFLSCGITFIRDGTDGHYFFRVE